ncbi:30S ribosomal protein S10 [Wolbachia endosymbiont of Cantharis cryptica]|uniref:30S ribosomal protein S10 n=1 Tax=Wolbachia endosymbiont of Cantharis cryptica TaxID=3066132 RepID=UPI00376F21A5
MHINVEVHININAFDSSLLEKYIRDFVRKFNEMLKNNMSKRFGPRLSGPVALPRDNFKFDVGRSPHVHKKSHEQFEQRTSKRLIVLRNLTPAIMQMFEGSSFLPSKPGVETYLTIKKLKPRKGK